jgi:hypothetical protein
MTAKKQLKLNSIEKLFSGGENNMKRILLFSVLLLIGFSLFGQDNLRYAP